MSDKKYIFVSDHYGIDKRLWDGYYIGKIYQYDGELHAVCNTDISKAKKYSSLKRAENAVRALNEKIINYEFEVKEI